MLIKQAAFYFSCAIFLFFAFELFIAPFPGSLLDSKSSVSLLFTDRDGKPLRETLSDDEKYSRWVPLEQISPHVIAAVIASEDSRFYTHHGIDLTATFRALSQNIRSRKVVSGGSTITQQLVRNMRPARRTVFNKAVEAVLAVQLERALTKDEIMYQYLNRIPYGNGAYGIESASQLYFDKRAKDLDLAESVFLTSLPRSPSGYDPYRHPERLRKRFERILAIMRGKGVVSERELKNAAKEKLQLVKNPPPFLAPHFVEYLLFSLDGKILKNANRVRTTLDLRMQERVEGIIAENLKRLEDKNVTNAAVVVIENKTGEILALAGSADYFDEKNKGMNNGALAKRQPGSALKPFTYSTALETGYTPATMLPDIEEHFSTPDGDYAPQNYDHRYHGPVRVRMAVANSLNVPAVYMAKLLGPELVIQYLRKAGISTLKKDASHYGLGITLGDGEVTLLDLARAYTVFPNLGKLTPIKTVFSYDLPGGVTERYKISAKPESVFSPQTAFIMADILSDANARAPTFGLSNPLTLPFRCGVKTGTSSNFRDNWTIGFTKEITVGVWVGNFDGAPMSDITGITGAGPIFRDVMRMAMESGKTGWLRRPRGIVEAYVCPLSGMRPGPDCPGEVIEMFRKDNIPREICALHRSLRIDERNGLLAGIECQPEFVFERTFTFYPPLYTTWAMKEGMEIPPREYSPLCGSDEEAPRERAALGIVFPDNGDVFAYDPEIPKEYQSIVLQAAAPDGTRNLTWLIDGKRVATVEHPYSHPWGIRKGKHTITAVANSMRESVEITVR